MGELPELRLLRSFVAVVEAGSLTRAAEGLHIAQQSLSQQMRTLEARIGAPLLRRTSRGVHPTTAGEVLHREAIAVLAAADRAMRVVDRHVRGDEGELRVGFLSSLANEAMPPVVRLLAERRPGIVLHAEDLPIAELVQGVRSGRLDAAVSRPPLVDDLVAETIGEEPVVVAVPEGHALADAGTLRLADLAGERWVMTPRSSWPPWHRRYDDDFAAAGYAPDVVQRGTTPQGLLALVAAGVGVTRLAASSRSLRSGGVRFVELAGETAATVVLTRPGAADPSLAVLHEVVRDAFALWAARGDEAS